MKILIVGDQTRGSYSAYRAAYFRQSVGVEVHIVPLFVEDQLAIPPLIQALAWKLRMPFDPYRLNRRVQAAARDFVPDVVFIDAITILRPATLRALKQSGAAIVGISQDYVTARHNSNLWQDRCFAMYDLFFTTKSYGVEELRAVGVGDVVLVNNSYEPAVHRPLTPAEVGDDFEAFDCVFVGTFERDRAASIRKLADAGLTVLVHGNAAGRLAGNWDALDHPNITLRPAANSEEYGRALHRGKVALAFLRKINRDQITCRSIEIPAMRRPMLAERTPEHDAQFVNGVEYLGFADDNEMIVMTKAVIANPARRRAIAEAGHARCLRDQLDNGQLVSRILATMRQKFAPQLPSAGGQRSTKPRHHSSTDAIPSSE